MGYYPQDRMSEWLEGGEEWYLLDTDRGRFDYEMDDNEELLFEPRYVPEWACDIDALRKEIIEKYPNDYVYIKLDGTHFSGTLETWLYEYERGFYEGLLTDAFVAGLGAGVGELGDFLSSRGAPQEQVVTHFDPGYKEAVSRALSERPA